MDNKKKSELIKMMRKAAGLSVPDLAKQLGRSVGVFNNKMFRNSWALEDIFKTADICCCDLIYSESFLDVFNEDGNKIGTIQF